MKELSVEEKAKRYDEAIEIAKKINNEQQAQPFNVMTRVFPELKESEDEKIRQELLAVVNDLVLPEEQQSRFVDWLEKQKESKYLDTSTCESWSDEQTRRNLINFLKSLGATEISQASYNRYLSYLEKQGEQKPDDETPYPETLEKAIDLYYYSYGNGEGEFEHLSLEKFRDIVHTFVSDYGQKPVWSEEDEKMLDIILNDINYSQKNFSDSKLIPYGRKVDWFKSLKDRVQPQNRWKPSDEQIKALEFFIPYVTQCSIVLQKSKDTLLSPLSDLKKLKG